MKDFSLLDHTHTQRSLKDFNGKWVILYFYPKDDTPGCTQEACDFNNILKELESLNTKVIGISPDSPETHKKFIEKYALQITLLSDPEKDILKAYEAWGIKKNYGKEYEGVIRSTFIINPEGVVVKSWRNVRAKGHVARVQKAYQQLRGSALTEE